MATILEINQMDGRVTKNRSDAKPRVSRSQTPPVDNNIKINDEDKLDTSLAIASNSTDSGANLWCDCDLTVLNSKPQLPNERIESFVADLCSEDPVLHAQELRPRVAGRFKIMNFLGGGGNGNVFSAFKTTPGLTVVALKIWKVKSCLKHWPPSELKKLRQLQDHEDFSESCIVRMHEYFQFCDHTFISFELLGPSLADVMTHDDVAFPTPQIQAIVFQILKALRFLHKNGVIHTDVKPGNIVFVRNEFPWFDRSKGSSLVLQRKRFKHKYSDVRLIDLELCVYTNTGRTLYNETLCTAEYRAPELLLRLEFDSKCDIWSLGCTVFELYHNRFLFSYEPSASDFEIHQLCLMEAVVGKPIPPEMAQKSGFKCFDELGKLKYNFQDRYSNEYVTTYMKIYSYVASWAGAGIQAKRKIGVEWIYKTLNQFIQIDPMLRITANEALEDDWFELMNND